jgi:hypothetical protein
MQVLVYADELAREWSEMITGHGYAATVLLPGQPYSGSVTPDMCLVAVSDPVAERFWMAHLTSPTLLITGALGPAQALCARIPALRLICHPTHAAGALEELLHMTQALLAGVVVLGPLVAPLHAKHGRGGPYGVS